MTKKRKTNSQVLQEKLEEIHKEIKEVRQIDIPKLQVDVAVMKEKATFHAKLISAIGVIIATVVSTAVAIFR